MLFPLLRAKKRPQKLQSTKRRKGMDKGVRKENSSFFRKIKGSKSRTDP
jgi:hypothetical protein